MHQGELSNLPGARPPPPNWDQISCYSDEKFDDCVVITGNVFPNYPSLFRDWKHRNKDYNKSRLWLQYNMTKQSRVLLQETKWERFQSIMINNRFCKWNYSSACSFLVNWILEEMHSHNIFGSKVIMIGFKWYLLHLYRHDITAWNATVCSSLMDY